MLSEKMEKIRGAELFSNIDVEALEKIVETGEFLTRQNGDVIFEEAAESNDKFYLILEGTVAIVKSMRDSEENVAVLSGGDYFGELALFSEMDRQAKTEVREKTKLLEISYATIDELKKTQPGAVIQLYENMFNQVAKRFKQMARKAEKSQFWF